MSRRKGRRIPLTEEKFLEKIFSAAILFQPGGMVVRKVSSVLRSSSETRLISWAKGRGLGVSRSGTHYLIFDPQAMSVSLC